VFRDKQVEVPAGKSTSGKTLPCARASRSVSAPGAPSRYSSSQGHTLVHLTAQRKRYWWDEGYLGSVQGVFKAVVEGVFRRSGDVLSVRNDSG
jgi:hypothetical protein